MGVNAHAEYDVIIATDCRLPGGTVASTAEEIVAQSRAGITTGLIHIDSPLVSRTRPFNPRVRACLDRGEAELILPGTSTTTQLLVIRHPKVALGVNEPAVPAVTAAKCLVLVNQEPVTGPNVHYRAHEVNDAVRQWTGLDPLWSPIGPLVRERFTMAEPDQPLTEDDWVNIIDVDAWRTPREPITSAPIKVGRHSRDHRLKWPHTRDELLQAYPPDDDIEIRVLGGARHALAVLDGDRPANWTVYPFGALEARDFLSQLDAYVYLHHPDLTEAFGRTLLEAMASGLPVLTDARFRPLFGDALVYVTPSEVAATLRRLAAEPEWYMELSRAGQRVARDRFGYERHVQRLREHGVASARPPEPTTPAEPSSRVDPPPAPTSRNPDRTVLFVSPNGAGMGHLARVMAVARRLPAGTEARFFTFSAAAAVVADQGFVVEYSPSRPVTRSTSAGWHRAVETRLGDLVDEWKPDVIVIDGTDPYRGVLRVVARHPEIAAVWLRRGMWKPGVTNAVVERGTSLFDLVIEPGDLATTVDRGVTRRTGGASVVGPITYLDASEMTPREDARRALGIEPDQRALLLNLGAGNINDTDSMVRTVIERLSHEPSCRVFMLQSPIALAKVGLGDHVVGLEMYPLARVMKAFDAAVVAVGYNTFHEALLARIPTLFVPNDATITDDQRARADWAASEGYALCASDERAETVVVGVERLLDREVADGLVARLATLSSSNGADEAAQLILGLSDARSDVEARSAERARIVRELESAAVGRQGRGSAATPAKRSPVERVRGLRRRLSRRVLGVLRSRLGDARLRMIAVALPGRWERRARSALGLGNDSAVLASSAQLRVPPGTPLGAIDERSLTRILVIIDPSVVNVSVAEEIAALQTVERTFAPVFLTSSLEGGGFRRFGYVWEYVRPHDPTLESHARWAERRQRRIVQTLEWYDTTVVVEVSEIDQVVAPDSLLRSLIRGFDPTRTD